MGTYKSGNPNAHDNLANAKNKGGRPKGSRAKTTNEMKKDMWRVYKMEGGWKGLHSWMKENKSEFYHHHIKANIPKESEVKVEGNFIVSWSEDDTKIKGPI
jgi:hypothetical protein